MQAFGDSPRRVDIGFGAGQSLAVRLREDAYKALRDALDGDGSKRWLELASEDATVLVDVSQVVFIRLDTQEQRVGFRGA
jgi:hypothetical protein